MFRECTTEEMIEEAELRNQTILEGGQLNWRKKIIFTYQILRTKCVASAGTLKLLFFKT